MKAMAFWGLALVSVMSLAQCSSEPSKLSKTATPENAGEDVVMTGIISDSTCGANHKPLLQTGSMGDDDASCTIICVDAGSKYVLVDPASNELYRLSDTIAAKKFAGKKVTVKGRLNRASKSFSGEAISGLDTVGGGDARPQSEALPNKEGSR